MAWYFEATIGGIGLLLILLICLPWHGKAPGS